ncbi:MAG: hypothetical protein GYB66_09145 [Chloroflexi bacterium]|nr:hypothetical protein [Chloroflexota bacterium]
MTEQHKSSTQNGWYVPVGKPAFVDHSQWFTPENAIDPEEMAAQQTASDVDAALQTHFDDVPGAVPKRPGAWYAPQDSAYSVEPAAALNDLLDAAFPEDEDDGPSPEAAQPPSASGDKTPRKPQAEGQYQPRPAPEVDIEHEGFRRAPEIEGKAPQGFSEAPDVPLSASLQGGLGGLRDVPIEEEKELEAEEGLSLEEAAQMRESDSQPLEVPGRTEAKPTDTPAIQSKADQQPVPVPSRGFGGVRDDAEGAGSGSKFDTGPVDRVEPQATRSLEGTDPVAPEQGQAPQPSGAAAASGTSSQPQTQTDQDMSSQTANAQKFREVERSVQTLRQQFAQGQITRNQLEAELRRLLVLDDQGRWWTLGVDSNRWYRYDGREWVPDTPPQTGPQMSAGVPTETGIQSPAGFSASRGATSQAPQAGGQQEKIAIDEYGMPLPARVPQDDPGATMVNLQSAITEDERGVGAEPTLASIERPGPGSEAEQTLRPEQRQGRPTSASEAAESVMPGPQAARSEDTYQFNAEGELIGGGVPVERRTHEDSIQPDYSEALGGAFSRSSTTKLFVWGGVVGVVAVLGVILCGLLGMIGYYFSVVNQYSDEINNLPERASSFQTTTLYASDGETVLAQFNDPERGVRQKVELEDVSPWVIHALVATEDESFYENPGFSMFAIARASYTNLTSSGPRSGASTITQQLARRLLLDEAIAAEVSASRKITEIILAAELSRKYTKNEILELYLNEMSFGSGVGIEAAAQLYFEKPASDLNIFESALLVGLVQSPTLYNPFLNRQAGLDRMETVLRLMQEANGDGCVHMEHEFNGGGFDLSQPLCVTEEYLVNEVPHLKAQVEIREFTPPEIEIKYAHFAFWVWDELVQRYGEQRIYDTGFEVVTTLDVAVQEAAQQAVRDGVDTYPRVNNGSVVAIDPNNGQILAMVGSYDYENKDIDGEVNVALTAQQPGSSIKPVVYLTAFEGFERNGEQQYWTPATIIWDTPSTWGNYAPVNFDGNFRGPVSARRALANSLNVPAVKTMDFVTPQRFEEVANRLNITFPLQSPVAAGLPAALGAAEVRLIDMVAAYGAFANNGVYTEPTGILTIETAAGETIFDLLVDANPADTVQTIEPTYAYLINSILSDDEVRRETFGTNYQGLDLPDGRVAAAKTGTTNDNRDVWTIGWTPQIIVGVWMGNTDNSPMGDVYGSTLAAPVWNRTMWQYVQNLPAEEFPVPAGIVTETICADSGSLIPEGDPANCGPGGTRTEVFVAGQPPPEETMMRYAEVDAFTNRLANQFCPDFVERRFFLVTDDPTAVNWIQNTNQGRSWANSRDIDPDNITGSLPDEECQPGMERPEVVLTAPQNGMTLSQLVTFYGVAHTPNFEYYEVEYAPASDPNAFTAIPGQRYEFEQTEQGSVLGTWPSTSLPDGQYVIRLTAHATTGATASSQPVQVTIRNQSATPPQDASEDEAIPSTETGTGGDTETQQQGDTTD